MVEIKGHGVFRKSTRHDVVDGRKAPWMVAVDAELGCAAGDFVRVTKASGEEVVVRLVTNYPYKTVTERDRFTFESVKADGTPDAHTLAQRAYEDEQLARTDLDLVDGQPVWWSRKTDGSLNWPRTGDVWRVRGEDELGVVVRSGTNKYKVGWYAFIEDLEVKDLPARFPDEVRRDHGVVGEWMPTGEFMGEYEFVWRRAAGVNHDA